MLSIALSLSIALAATAAAQQPEQKLSESAQKAKEAVVEQLQKIKSNEHQIIWLDNEALAKAFPKHTFFAVRSRLYPVARQIPDGLAASNIFVVADGKLEHLKDNKALEAFFKTHFGAVDDKSVNTALAGYLTLSQEFVQDGFYKFEIDNKGFAVASDGKRLIGASGRAIAMQGGNGEINVNLKVDDKGKVAEVAFDSAKLRPGPRPICQATKLLDADTIVRRMAEQDLLCMGLAARDYLMEQRATASPELRQEIDRLWARIVKNGW